jgi:short-subunit dehydrogenase
MPYMPVYAPSKAFVLQFSLALREELRGTPVRVSVLCPNGIRTNAECRAKIEASGPLAQATCMDPDQVAREALEGALADRAMIVPGRMNRVIVLAGRYTPRALVQGVVSRIWGRTARVGQGKRDGRQAPQGSPA